MAENINIPSRSNQARVANALEAIANDKGILFDAIEVSEQNRTSKEATRETNEAIRKANEDTRKANEIIREYNEDARELVEVTRTETFNGWTNETTGLQAQITRIVEDTEATNILGNPDFSQGTYYWTTGLATGVSTANNEASFKATAYNGEIGQTMALDANKRYYIRTDILADSPSVKLVIQRNSAPWNIIYSKPCDGNGTWGTISYVTPYIGFTANYRIRIADERSSGWTTVKLKNPMVVDLTSMFGAGKEPNVKEFEEYVTDYPDKWFKGSEKILNISKVRSELSQKGIATFNLKDFGAVGDGVTDDYQSLVDLSSAVNANKGGFVIIPPGDYYIDRVGYFGGENYNWDKMQPITFEGCEYLSIQARGAKITNKRNIHYAYDATAAQYFTHVRSLGRINIRDCRNVEIVGLEVDGGALTATRDTDVKPGNNNNIDIGGCKRVYLEDVYSHHAPTDGIMLWAHVGRTDDNGKYFINEDLVMVNCRSEYNSRQGLSCCHVKNSTFINCQFNYTGYTSNTQDVNDGYRGSNPVAGIDFEMDLTPNYVEDVSRNLTFINCQLIDNFNSIAMARDDFKEVAFYNCKIKTFSASTVSFIMQGKGLSFDKCVIEDNGSMLIDYDRTGNRLTLRDCDIKLGGIYLTYSGGSTSKVSFLDNRITDTYIQIDSAPNCIFRDNDFHYTAEFYPEGQPAYAYYTLLKGIRLSANNRFTTTLPIDGSQKHYAVNYTGTEKVDNDYFESEAIRPKALSTFHTGTSKFYSTGQQALTIKSPLGVSYMLEVDETGVITTKNVTY